MRQSCVREVPKQVLLQVRVVSPAGCIPVAGVLTHLPAHEPRPPAHASPRRALTGALTAGRRARRAAKAARGVGKRLWPARCIFVWEGCGCALGHGFAQSGASVGPSQGSRVH
jgi:hypothetical protein